MMASLMIRCSNDISFQYDMADTNKTGQEKRPLVLSNLNFSLKDTSYRMTTINEV